jgi:hypothetical protein
MPGLDPGIHAEPHFSMGHRVEPGGDEVSDTGAALSGECRGKCFPYFVIAGLDPAIHAALSSLLIAPSN